MKNKNIIAFILVFVLILPLAGCTNWGKQSASLPTPTPMVEVTPTPIPTPTPISAPTPTAAPTPEPTSPLPIINKDPTSETVYEGGGCMFVSWFENATIAVWHFVSPDDSIDLTYTQAAKQFPTLIIINGMYSIMTLDNIPLGLNGWKVYCEYQNENGSINTGTALITVLAKAVPAPTPIPTLAPTPTIVPTLEPSVVPNPEATNTSIFIESAQEFVNWLTAISKDKVISCEILPESFTIHLKYETTSGVLEEIELNASNQNISIAASVREILNFDTTGIQNLEHFIIELIINDTCYYELDLVTDETLQNLK